MSLPSMFNESDLGLHVNFQSHNVDVKNRSNANVKHIKLFQWILLKEMQRLPKMLLSH